MDARVARFDQARLPAASQRKGGLYFLYARLAGLAELDESFFGPKGTTRGRGSENKATVLCAVSLYTDKEGKERLGFARMAVFSDASAATIEDFLEKLGCNAETEECRQLMKAIRSDRWRSYGRGTKDK